MYWLFWILCCLIVLLLICWYINRSLSTSNIKITNINGSPSIDASNNAGSTEALLTQLLQLDHDAIVAEVVAELQRLDNDVQYMVVTERLPRLVDIVKSLPRVTDVRVIIERPGTLIIEQPATTAIYQSLTFHYRYGLRITDHEVGLAVNDRDVLLSENQAIIWPTTLGYTTWNHTMNIRLIIQAMITSRSFPIGKSD